MAISVTNLTMGPGTLYRATFGAAEPLDTQLNTSPPASGWTDVGGTQDGVQLTVDLTYKELEVDQVVDIPGQRLTKRVATLETNLAEPTLANLALALNASAPTSGTGYVSYDPPNDTSATQPIYSALIFDGIAPGGFRRRIIVRRVLQTDGVKFAYKKDDQTVFNVSFTGHYVSASITPFRILDATS